MPAIENKQVEELKELNEELEDYFVNTIIPQLFVDADLILRKYTPPAMTQFKFSTVHIGRPIKEMLDNIKHSTLIENIEEVIDTGEIYEKEIQTTDQRWFQMNIVPYIVRKLNKQNGVIITFVDITERVQDLNELEKMNAAHETFIFSVSHDLKAPLGNIESLIPILSEPEHDLMEKKRISGMLVKAVKNMRKIIDELSDITKVEGDYKEITEVVSFKKIVREVEMVLSDKIVESKATINVNLEVESIRFSRKNIRSIFFNLLSNAIKYQSPSQPPVLDVTTKRDGENIIIKVSDNGMGIAEDKLGEIFDKFSRIEEKGVAGSGIGLYLVKRMVDNHKGKITVTSEFGKGSEFNIWLKG
ncbi:MAG: ATP-binding protein [Chryseolinea sp.]